MGSSGPPKCRTCGTAEWRHVCGKLPKVAGVAVCADLPPAASAPPEMKVTVVDTVVYRTDEPPDNYTGMVTLGPGEAIIGFLSGIPIVGKPLSAEAPVAVSATPTGKTDRKEYLRLKAVERRAATKMGLTVAAYRTKMAKKSKEGGDS